jgi:hypothetical protein
MSHKFMPVEFQTPLWHKLGLSLKVLAVIMEALPSANLLDLDFARDAWRHGHCVYCAEQTEEKERLLG